MDSHASVQNVGKQPNTFESDYQRAVRPNGALYAPDVDAERYANIDNNALWSPINPGNTATGVLVFDIPKDARVVSLELHESRSTRGAKVKVT